MIELYYYPLSVTSRFARLILAECDVTPSLIEERIWERRPDFLIMNAAGTLPVMVENGGPPIAGIWPVCEYLDETRGFSMGERRLLPPNADQRAEVRRLTDWFVTTFEAQVTGYLVEEKVVKRELAGSGRDTSPDSSRLRAARANIKHHIRYIDHLLVEKNWLAGDKMSYADLAAAAALSVADYLNEVPWKEAGETKDWYAKVKSRPSFRPLLADLVRGSLPPRHYKDLDF